MFATQEEATRILETPDLFVEQLSPFDRQARLGSGQPVSQAEYLKFAGQQALAWSDQEKQALTADIQSADQKLQAFKLNLPKPVLLIKTTGLEEGGAAYTRGPAIILPQRKVGEAGTSQESLLLHELFHVLSRHDQALREKLYAAIGFRKCGQLELPESMKDLKLTNPDGPLNDHCIQIKHQGNEIWAMPILYSTSPYNPAKGGKFFQYMTFKLIAIESPQAEPATRPQLKNGQPILLDPQTAEGYLAQIGTNTGYIIHPDEVLADNFVFLANKRKNLPSPEVLNKMADCLK